MAMWRVDICQLLGLSLAVPLAPHKHPIEERKGRNGAKKRPDGSNSGGRDNNKEAKNRPLQVQIHHAPEWNKGMQSSIMIDYCSQRNQVIELP